MIYTDDKQVLASNQAEYMNQAQLDYFKQKLLDMQTELKERSRQTTSDLQVNTTVEADPVDRAAQEEQFALELRARDRERKLLVKVEQALRAIDDGSYGFCQDTGEEIGLARLLIRPTAMLTVEAQERREVKKRTLAS